MKRTLKTIATTAIILGIASSALADWNTFVIRENSTEGAPVIQTRNDVAAGAIEFITFASSQKAGLGTDLGNSLTISDLAAISISRLDDTSRFTAGSGPAVAPYFNIWITDGAGNYAVVANEPSNAEWQPGDKQWDMTWGELSTKSAKIYEAAGPSPEANWVYTALGKDTGITFSDLAAFAIGAPDVAFVAANYPAGKGTPRELSTSIAYDFNWVFGDTLSNYVSGEDGFIVSDPVVVIPEPATLGLIALCAGGLYFKRRFFIA